MTETKEIIKGRAYNFTFDPVKRKRVVGWYVIITEGGQEYLVKQNSSQPWRCYRKVYQSDYSFKELLVSNSDLKKNTWHTPWWQVPILYGAGKIVTRLIPEDIMFGKFNQSFDLVEGISNMIFMMGLVGLVFFVLSTWRTYRLRNYLQTQENQLILVGKIRSNTPITHLSNGKGIW